MNLETWPLSAGKATTWKNSTPRPSVASYLRLALSDLRDEATWEEPFSTASSNQVQSINMRRLVSKPKEKRSNIPRGTNLKSINESFGLRTRCQRQNSEKYIVSFATRRDLSVRGFPRQIVVFCVQWSSDFLRDNILACVF